MVKVFCYVFALKDYFGRCNYVKQKKSCYNIRKIIRVIMIKITSVETQCDKSLNDLCRIHYRQNIK